MSCRNNIDPYNNHPPGKGCASGKCATRDISGGFPQAPPPQQMPQAQGIDPLTENMLLKQDLDLAIAYIQHLGGSWPRPQQRPPPHAPRSRHR